MTQIILLVIIFFLVVRTVWRLVRRGLFFFRSGGGESIRQERSQQIEESDYEVLESRINGKENDGV